MKYTLYKKNSLYYQTTKGESKVVMTWRTCSLYS